MFLKSNYLNFGVVLAFLAGFAIPTSTALQNITIAVIYLIVLFNHRNWGSLKLIAKNYFVIFSVILYLVFLIWVFISKAPRADVLHMLSKMRVYLLCPLLLVYFFNQNYRISAYIGFALGGILTLIISFWNFTKNIFYPTTLPGWSCGLGDWRAFRYHTDHNYFLALLVVGIISLFLYYRTYLAKQQKLILGLVVLLCAIDILYLVPGRAGQILFVLALFLVFLLWNLRKGIVASTIIAIMIPLVIYSSPIIRCGIDRVQSDVINYDGGDPDSSYGLRLEFHKYSLELIQASPIIGYGTGSFGYAYQKLTGFNQANVPAHPHNDFYWLWVELGILGPGLLLAMLGSMVYYGLRYNNVTGNLLIVVAITYAIGALQGGFFTDNITGSAFMVIAAVLFGANLNKSQTKEQAI